MGVAPGPASPLCRVLARPVDPPQGARRGVVLPCPALAALPGPGPSPRVRGVRERGRAATSPPAPSSRRGGCGSRGAERCFPPAPLPPPSPPPLYPPARPWNTGEDGGRGAAKSFSCLPSLGAGYLAPSLLSLPSSGPRAGKGSSALSPATVRACLQATGSPPGSCCFCCFQTQLSRPLALMSGEGRSSAEVSCPLRLVCAFPAQEDLGCWGFPFLLVADCISAVEKNLPPSSGRPPKLKMNVNLKRCENEGWIIACSVFAFSLMEPNLFSVTEDASQCNKDTAQINELET
ncbi:zinc finger protein ZIC 5-like [Pezoporus flaviventris]|uniref:zinc finger protein ZIC 5-like n=1 Tax=Pezoporus flaviventris TaxID=889875 RepID=UPI002AB16160|nr:zinc finger protein ZIC 5-like [Pezoporus flaviventris]